MHVTFTNTIDDLVDAAYQLSILISDTDEQRSSRWRIARHSFFNIATSGFAMEEVADWIALYEPLWWMDAGGLPVYIMMGLVLAVITAIWNYVQFPKDLEVEWKRSTRGFLVAQGHESFNGTYSLLFNDDGLIVQFHNLNVDKVVPWQSITNLYITDNHVIIYPFDGREIIVPRRSMITGNYATFTEGLKNAHARFLDTKGVQP